MCVILLLAAILSKNIESKTKNFATYPFVLYGCETWSVTLRKKHTLRVFEREYLDLSGRKW